MRMKKKMIFDPIRGKWWRDDKLPPEVKSEISEFWDEFLDEENGLSY